ncbi:3-oxoacyl-[acyl-carrier protein] reductase [Cystobacter fuscus DSM 2262]|uniref:3-oxoacyl-[acyl-carrier protein] reductase n=1 Tax=Cystobacter fuscus (strain ATCC 25194 / DSM 2262 / NBRC 100088 / M29) TaxID=1242864 RepID=S9QVM1_CYSF2|nr:SDR family oxidoreductase [Cystobacter fuscus]EPX60703.1 3-oxoacyl-[acyl-carrier protein] reductase [Cystobacter fuscus DSM 2262]
MDLQLNKKTALVTGGTAGIGLEIARTLAVEGAEVLITGRSRTKLDQAVEDIRASGGKHIRGVVVDVTAAEGLPPLRDAARDVDILVNNLGAYESKAFAEISDDDWQSFFNVNVMSGVRLARAYFPGMLERGWGRIIFISSESALTIPPDMIHYATTKTAQLSIARGLAQLARGTRVTVNSVLPGPTRSEGIVDFLRSVSSNPSAPPETIEAEFFKNHRPASLLQRMIEPQEIASMVAYLASPLSAATNGAVLRAEGGLVNTIS